MLLLKEEMDTQRVREFITLHIEENIVGTGIIDGKECSLVENCYDCHPQAHYLARVPTRGYAIIRFLDFEQQRLSQKSENLSRPPYPSTVQNKRCCTCQAPIERIPQEMSRHWVNNFVISEKNRRSWDELVPENALVFE